MAAGNRFVLPVGGVTVGICAAYVVVAYLAPGALGTAIGWIGGVALIVLTWVVSFAYLRKSDREWSPMEQRIAASQREPSGRFARDAAPVREEVR